MNKLVTAALLVALAGGARADAPATAAPEKPAKPAAAKRAGAKQKQSAKQKHHEEARGEGAAKPPPEAPAKAPDGKGEKPCEPVKPCPID